MSVFRDHNGHALLIVSRGRKYLHAVTLHNPPVRVVALPKAEERYLTPMPHKAGTYPIRQAVKAFLKAGRDLGITNRAKQALKAIRSKA